MTQGTRSQQHTHMHHADSRCAPDSRHPGHQTRAAWLNTCVYVQKQLGTRTSRQQSWSCACCSALVPKSQCCQSAQARGLATRLQQLPVLRAQHMRRPCNKQANQLVSSLIHSYDDMSVPTQQPSGAASHRATPKSYRVKTPVASTAQNPPLSHTGLSHAQLLSAHLSAQEAIALTSCRGCTSQTGQTQLVRIDTGWTADASAPKCPASQFCRMPVQ